MSRVKILVEGQTEETFVNEVLFTHLAGKGVFIAPILLTTKRVKNRSPLERTQPGRRFKGGISTYAKVKLDVRNALQDRGVTAVTTMIDFYGLPVDFPGMNDLSREAGKLRVSQLEQAFANDINSHRFHPFLTLHEFEALLFSSPSEIANAFPEQRTLDQLKTVRNSFQTPEEINQGPETHPAARITSCINGYRKPFHGALIANRIGLYTIRQECDHFNNWVTWLESLA